MMEIFAVLLFVAIVVLVVLAALDREKAERENREALAEVERLKKELAYWTAERKAAEKQLAELRAIKGLNAQVRQN